ncbi:MAG: carboxypeptidase regulatory-like domain-containing protein, partial [Bryobacteraceae bacterium]|nr:carboxypeptidase regulatory-like domain-containing protein [Bryobacteraceae bacterium]
MYSLDVRTFAGKRIEPKPSGMPKLRTYAALLPAVLIVSLLFPYNLQAQAIDGNLTGTVLDAAGASIPEASIAAENSATGVRYSTTSDLSGAYRINNVPVGIYSVSAMAVGFQKVRLEKVIVELNRTSTTVITLQVGNVSESVTVTEAFAAVDVTTSQLQSTYARRQVLDLPMTAHLLGANNLSLLSAGVAGSGGYGAGEGPSVGGQRPRNNSFNIEGVDNNRKDVTGSLTMISNEAVAEFTLLQNQYSAEFGHSGGGVFNTILKSGTNTLHGAAYEYLQNRNLNAVDQADARQGFRSNQRLDNNRFGGNISGPIVRNKLFYFGQLEYQPIGFASSPAAPTFAPTADGYRTLQSLPGVSKANLGVLQTYLTAAPSATQTTPVGGVNIPIGVIPIAFPAFQNTRSWIVSSDYSPGSRDQIRGRFVSRPTSGVDGSTVPGLPAFLNSRGTTT